MNKLTDYIIKEYLVTDKCKNLVKNSFAPVIQKLLRLHELSTPSYGEEGFYRTGISFDAFFNYKYTERQFNKNIWYTYDRKSDFERQRIILNDFIDIKGNLYSDIEIIKHNSLQDFFNYIGYDRKTKKYVRINK